MKTKFSLLFINLLFLLSSPVYSQNRFYGIVTDKLNGEGLTGANIFIPELNRGTIAGKDGSFEIILSEEQAVLVISYVGYETITMKASSLQSLKIEMDRDLIAFNDDVVITGTRSVPRTVTSSAVPIDQFPQSVLANTGKMDLSQQLNSLAPSFYSSRLTYSDATDHLDPVTLRGMNPDQTLILVNGKRHHPSAVVNVLSVVGKGSVINDLNTIPSSAIDRVEILRDGASAQYGSDAIGGVVNLILRQDTGKVSMKTRVGQTYEGDGLQSHFSANFGKGFKGGGYVNVTTQLGVREKTNRAGTYQGLIYRTSGQDGLTFEENLAIDNSLIESRGLSREDFQLQLGESEMSNANLFFNSAVPMMDRSEFYAFGGLNYRNSLSAGDYRLPNDAARGNLAIYPDGFLPEISARLTDQYITAGIRSQITDWEVDFSNTYGSNAIDFYVGNSLNASMGDDSPLEFESGRIRFSQNTTSLDFSHRIIGLSKMRAVDILIGSEIRYENYRIMAGEEASWINENQLAYPGAQG
ncbi:MAG: TonB-dependent receptor plug domain-containing protein, partial [Bacteroidales bacterium]|nr:TonB-dependent receptor plug domain-containing protein [Bacteroidales bacterium]